MGFELEVEARVRFETGSSSCLTGADGPFTVLLSSRGRNLNGKMLMRLTLMEGTAAAANAERVDNVEKGVAA